MASATDFIDVTSATAFIPEIWSALAIVQRESRLVFGGLVDRRFEEGLSFGDTIHVPNVGNLAARDKSTTDNAPITYETVLQSNTNISINVHKYAAIAVESIAEVQTNRDQLKLYAGKLGYAVGLAVDDSLAALVDALNNNVGALAVGLDTDDWLRAIQYLDDENVPPENRVAVISPAERMNLLKDDKYIHGDYALVHGDTPRTTSLTQAYTRSFFDVPVYVTTNVDGTNAAGHDNVMFQKEALALVMQLTPTLRHQYDIDYLCDKVALENIYGVSEMRDDSTYGRYGVWMKGS